MRFMQKSEKMFARSVRTVTSAGLLVAAIFTVASVGLFYAPHEARAAAPTMTAVASDQTADGTIDRIVITFSEPVSLVDGNAGNGFTSLALGNGCTIANLDYANASTTTLTLSNLTGCTAGNTALTPSVTYTAVADCTTASSICDAALANQMVNSTTTNATDGASPVLMSVALATVSNRNRMTFTYSEAMTITNGASTSTKGDTTLSGTVAGFGSFLVPGNVTVGTGKNTVSGSGTAVIALDLADQVGGSFSSASTTEPSGVFTPVGSAVLVDAASLQVNTSTTPSASSSGWDLVKPTIISVTLADATGNNGRVDRAAILFDSAVRDSNIIDGEALLGGGSNTGTFATGTANDATTFFSLTADTLAVDTSATAAQFTYTPIVAKITDLVGNRLDTASDGSIAAGDVVELDGAAPVVVSSTPASGAAGVLRTSTISLVFSEVIASLTTSISGGVTLTNGSLASSTVALTGTKIAGANTLTIATAPDATGNGFNRFLETGTSAISFTVASSSSSSGAVSVPLTYAVNISSPVATAAYEVGDEVPVRWETSGTGTIAAVNLDYSTDGGLTYTSIVTGTMNDGVYTWTAPDVTAQSITLRAQGTDLVTVLATDTSDAFSITGTEDSSDASSDESSDTENTDTSSTSTTLLAEGTFMKGASWSTVYYVGANGTRRPFLDSQTFFTYADDFESVIETSDEYLANYMIGEPMMPKAGSVLIKVQSVNKVYVLGAENELRWITSEDVAKELFGNAWADYVIDVPATAWARFTVGADITASNEVTVDRDSMETRDVLNSK